MLGTLFVLGLLVATSAVHAQSTSFTYQGRLTDGGTAANGNYDLQFALFDSLSGGAQVGSPQTLNTVAVSNGVFTVSLDFSANAFPGASRFLEISARPSGGGSFTLLSPRQQITSTPYAVRSLNASSADSVPASGVPAGSGNYIQNGTNQQIGNFAITGNGIAGGTLSARQFNFGSVRLLGVTGSGGINDSLFLGVGAGQSQTIIGNNTFVGHRAGLNNLNGSSNTFVGNGAGENTSSGGNNVFLGASAGNSNTAGNRNTAIGAFADVFPGPIFNPTNATAIGSGAAVTDSNSLVLGSIRDINGANADTNVGIGTTAPKQRLHVKGQGLFTADTATFDPGDGVGPATRIGFDLNGGYGYINANHTGVTAKNLILQPNSSQGNVGIGTTAPDQRLSVIGNASKSAGGTSWAIFSDERLKNIKGPFTPGLNALLKLQPIRYQYKPDNALGLPGGSDEVGFSAQAVERVLPEAVSRNQQGYRQLHSDPILWTMLNAIKEQQAQIAQQQRQIQGLKKLVCRSRRRAAMCK